MQENLSVSRSTLKNIQEFLGQRVPWEVEGYAEEFHTAETTGGCFDLSDWGVVSISGPDALDYLNRMSTVAVKKMQPAEVLHGAFLTGRGLVIGLGCLQQLDKETFHYIVSTGQSERVATHLEQFHFQEKLTVADVSQDWAIFGCWGMDRILEEDVKALAPLQVKTVNQDDTPFMLWRDDARPRLIWVKMKREKAFSFLTALEKAGIKMLGRKLFEYYRIRSGVPEVGIEATEKTIILETNFERAVARNKGCYPGQEVVERIFTYGSVNRKLLPVEVRSKNDFPPVPFDLSLDGKVVGEVVSMASEPNQSGAAIGLAYLHKTAWDWRTPFTAPIDLEVRLKC